MKILFLSSKFDNMDVLFIPYDEMKDTFSRILVKQGFTPEKADICASVFADNSLEGVYSHGVNRFPRFVRYIRKGYIQADALPSLVHRAGAIEQWNGNFGPGPLNALFAVDRAMQIAANNGIGLIGMAHTNHWQRGGYYGWEAAKKGFAFIGWTNTTPNMPAWGGKNPKLGNNPFVMAVPYGKSAIVLDMALSQYSFGKMEEKQLAGEKLPTQGGYDLDGNLTDDPGKVLESWRTMPVGFWKGAAFSLMLDIFAAMLSGGLSTAGVGKNEDEYGVSQVFIAIDPSRLFNFPAIQKTLEEIIADLKASIPAGEGLSVRYPGERVVKTREENLKKGIPVNRIVWEEILGL
jgi:3-dehydro-L-gulonate 2-dehydrogenase